MEIKKWSGIRNTESAERLKQGELATGSDIDINNSMKILSRQGQTVISATASHSLYSNDEISLLAQGTSLYAIEANLSLTLLATLSNSSPISYDSVAGRIYYSNGIDKGIITGRTKSNWGVELPQGQPVATEIGGNLPAGKYLYVITFVRRDGHESGTGISGLIEVGADAGIRFENIGVSTDTAVSGIILYISSTNGEVMYQAAVLPNGLTTYEYRSDSLDLTVALRTQFCVPPIAGTIVREHFGRMYVVTGNLVLFSEAYEPELFRPDVNFLQFPTEVTMFEGVEDGIYLGTLDETWFLAGGDPHKYDPKLLFDYGVIPGTAKRTLASVFETNYEGESRGEQAGLAAVWTSSHGICLGKNGGQVVNLTEVKYSFPDAQIGAGLVRQDRGFGQYIVSLRGAGAALNSFEG